MDLKPNGLSAKQFGTDLKPAQLAFLRGLVGANGPGKVEIIGVIGGTRTIGFYLTHYLTHNVEVSVLPAAIFSPLARIR